MVCVEELQEKVLQKLDMSKEIADDELMDVIHKVLEENDKSQYITLKQKVGIGKELFNTFRKLDILQELLEDDDITEIMINGTEYIFIEKEGQLIKMEKRFVDRKKLEDIVQQIVAGSNRIVNEASPIVDARLADGSRVNIVLYPVALNGPIVTIRKFPKEAMTMGELIVRGALNAEIEEFLKKLMIARYNIFISGGTGSG